MKHNVVNIKKKHAESLNCLCLSINSAESGCEAVGQLGDMSKAQALASLLSCPLLEDLSEWSQWDLIFKPQHDSLKDFVERNAGINLMSTTVGSVRVLSLVFLLLLFTCCNSTLVMMCTSE